MAAADDKVDGGATAQLASASAAAVDPMIRAAKMR
jgi:hypothetical protein